MMVREAVQQFIRSCLFFPRQLTGNAAKRGVCGRAYRFGGMTALGNRQFPASKVRWNLSLVDFFPKGNDKTIKNIVAVRCC